MAGPPPLPSTGQAPAAKSKAALWVLAGVGAFLLLCVTALLAFVLLATYRGYKTREAHSHNGILPKPTDRLAPFGRANVPAWVPHYPRSSRLSVLSTNGGEQEDGIFAFQTDDSPDKVSGYYLNHFQSSGMKVNVGARTGILIAQDRSQKHKVTVMIGTQANQTSVTVNYTTNK